MEKPIINMIKKILKSFKVDHFWLQIKITQPHNGFDIP